MRDKGAQQYICRPMPLQAIYNNTCRLTNVEQGTHVKLQGGAIHKQGSKCKGTPQGVQCSSYKTPKAPSNPPTPCTSLGLLPMHEHHPNSIISLNSKPPYKNPNYHVPSKAQCLPNCKTLLGRVFSKQATISL
jgi:hypothetical protein